MARFPLTWSTDRAGCRSGSPRGIYVSMNAGSVGDHRAFLGDNVDSDKNMTSFQFCKIGTMSRRPNFKGMQW